jgi:hypothetical protein
MTSNDFNSICFKSKFWEVLGRVTLIFVFKKRIEKMDENKNVSKLFRNSKFLPFPLKGLPTTSLHQECFFSFQTKILISEFFFSSFAKSQL